VEVLRKSGGIINYNCQVFIESDIIGNPNLVLSTLSIEHSAPLIMEQVKAPGPVWLRDFMGIEFVSDVVDVVLDSLTDDEMKYFVDLPKVHSITILNSNISDAGLNHLEGLTQLRILNLRGTKVTDAGVNELQDALPNLKIERR
jgi:hypothetical protein